MKLKIPSIDKRVYFILTVLILGTVIYFVFFHMSTGKAYKTLGKKSFGGLGNRYVIARAKAIKEKRETFSLDNKTFLTETGKAI